MCHKKSVCGLCLRFLTQSSQIPWNFLHDRSVFCVHEVTLDWGWSSHHEKQLGISKPHPHLPGGGKCLCENAQSMGLREFEVGEHTFKGWEGGTPQLHGFQSMYVQDPSRFHPMYLFIWLLICLFTFFFGSTGDSTQSPILLSRCLLNQTSVLSVYLYDFQYLLPLNQFCEPKRGL